MPKIEPSNLQTTPQGPVAQQLATGADAGDGAAWEKFGESVSTSGKLLQKRQEQIEVSDLNAKVSALHSQTMDDFRDGLAKATPGDQTFADKFMENLNNNIDDIGSNVNTRLGQQYFQDAAGRLRKEFDQKANLGQANLASQSTVNNFTDSHNSTTAMLLQNPDQFDTANANEQAAIQASWDAGSFGKGAKDIPEKLMREYQVSNAVAAVEGYIKKDPNDAKKQLDDGDWSDILGAPQMETLYGKVNQELRAQRVDAQLQKMKAKQALSDADEKINQDFAAKYYAKTLNGQDVIDSKLQSIKDGGKMFWLGKLEQQANTDTTVHGNAQTFVQLLQQANLPFGDPNRLKDTASVIKFEDGTKDGISSNQVTDILKVIDGRQHTPEADDEALMKKNFFDGVKGEFGKVNGSGNFDDKQAGKQYADFSSGALQQYRLLRDKGISARDLVGDQTSDNYLGKTAIIDSYKRPIEAIMADKMKLFNRTKKNPNDKGLIPKRAGETVGEYINRTTGIK